MLRQLAALAVSLSIAAPASAGPAPRKPAPHPDQPAPARPAEGGPPGRMMGSQTTCTTQGDALGGLEITAAGTAVTMVESTMAGTKKTFKATAKPEQVLAMAQGKGAGFIFKSKTSNEFGGAVSNAALLVVGPRDASGKREGWLARAGTVFVLHCDR